MRHFVVGSLPAALFQGTSLTSIALGQGFSGTLPSLSASSTSSALKSLNLSTNKLSGVLNSSFITSLVALSSLSLANNQLVGISTTTQWPSSLQALDLSHNRILNSLSQIVFPSYLTILDLSYNSLSGTVPCSLSSISLLDVRGNSRLDCYDNCFSAVNGFFKDESLLSCAGMEILLCALYPD